VAPPANADPSGLPQGPVVALNAPHSDTEPPVQHAF
jgi:hypothetical protein